MVYPPTILSYLFAFAIYGEPDKDCFVSNTVPVTMGKVWSTYVELGWHCSDPTSRSTLTPALSAPVPTHLLWEGSKGWLCTREQNRAKDLVYVRGLYQVIYKRKQVRPSQTLSQDPSSRLSNTAWPTQNQRIGEILCNSLPFLSLFLSPLALLYKTKLSYSTSHTELCCGCRELVGSVVASGPAPLRSLLCKLRM